MNGGDLCEAANGQTWGLMQSLLETYATFFLIFFFFFFFLLIACVYAQSLQLCPTLCDPIDCSPPGSFVHGIYQARILE